MGRHLDDHLGAMGDQVVSVDLEVDVADPDAIGAAVAAARPEAIYHLAALSHVGESWEFPAEVLRVNVLGTAGYHTAYQCVYPSPASCNNDVQIYSLGYNGDAPKSDSYTPTSLLRWGNYDTVSGTVRFCGSSSNTGWSTTCGSQSEIPTGLTDGLANTVPTVGDTGAGQSAMPASFY